MTAEQPAGNLILDIGGGLFGAYNVSADEQTPASFSNTLTGINLGLGTDPVIGHGLSIQVNLSPGDTASVDGYFAIGDVNNPLPNATAVGVLGDPANEIADELLNAAAVPLPPSLLLSALAVPFALRARKQPVQMGPCLDLGHQRNLDTAVA